MIAATSVSLTAFFGVEKTVDKYVIAGTPKEQIPRPTVNAMAENPNLRVLMKGSDLKGAQLKNATEFGELKPTYDAQPKLVYQNPNYDFQNLQKQIEELRQKSAAQDKSIGVLQSEIARASHAVAILYADSSSASRDRLATAGFADWADSNRRQPKYCCANCGRPGLTKKCGKCLEARYCSEDCQKSHLDAHKAHCKRPPKEDIVEPPRTMDG